MAGQMVHYYFFKEVIQKVDKLITDNIEVSDDYMFACANVLDLGNFYHVINNFKHDEYEITKKLHKPEFFYLFLIECIKQCKADDSYEELCALYAISSHFILDKYTNPYLNTKIEKKRRFDRICSMLDYHYALKYDELDISKKNLVDVFPAGFLYYEQIEKLIHHPISKTLGFFCSNSYFTRAMKRNKEIHKSIATTPNKLKLGFVKFLDLFRFKDKRKLVTFMYNEQFDIDLLNEDKNEYIVDGVTYKHSFDELLKLALKETLDIIEAINSYMFDDSDRLLKKVIDEKYMNEYWVEKK